MGAGNGGMGAAAYAAAHGLNFRVIEQNGNVQDTRHWVGAVDGFGAQAQGIKMDRAKLLSEISRYASGKCDQRGKQAVFAIIPDNDGTFNYVVGMLYTCAFQSLYYQADKVHQRALPVPV